MHLRTVRGACASLGMLAVMVALGLVLASGAAAHTVVNEDATAQPGMGPAHWFGPNNTYGTFEAPPSLSFFSALVVDNLTNPGNNEIMPSTRTHLIFWLPAGYHYTSATDAGYEAQITKYFQDVGGSQILNTATQYTGSNGTVTDSSTFVDSIVDTTGFPKAGTVADPLKQGDINTEVFNQIGAHAGWNLGMNDMYFVFLPNNVIDCNNAGTSCNNNKYCAYHTYGFSDGTDDAAHDFVWADIPDNRQPGATLGGCGDSNVTGNESADTTLSSTEHEHLEAITDPRLNAWQDSTGAENGDKCNREMGVADSSKTTANNYLGAGNADLFRIQREWSNAVSGCAASYTTTGSGVESPVPTGGDVTLGVAEATIAGNPVDSLTYTLTFRNPSNQDDALGITVTDTLPAGVQYLGSGTANFSLGELAPHQTATKTFVAHPAGPLPAGAILTDTAVFAFNDSTGTAQPTITRTATTTVVNAPPVLGPLSPQTVDYHDPLSFGVSATDSDAGDTLALSASGLPAGLTLVDHGDRTATVSGTATAIPGVYTVTITVDDHHNPPVSATMTITVTREESTTVYTGPLVILAGASGATLSAHFYEDASAAASPTGQSITLSLGANSCVATVLPSGDASCVVPVTVALGPQPVSAIFAGDTFYLPSSDTGKTAIVFSMPSGGAFVLGDGTVAAAGASTVVTWWGAKWSGLNTLSGGSAPNAFKGFVDSLTGLPTATPPGGCSGTFGTTGGNSSSPPSSVPGYMGVIVTGAATKHGSEISGSWSHIVVVKVGSGYAANPGHAGTGTIVATYC
jgi:uncharacterized repeat protein (TIGR01451 family)